MENRIFWASRGLWHLLWCCKMKVRPVSSRPASAMYTNIWLCTSFLHRWAGHQLHFGSNHKLGNRVKTPLLWGFQIWGIMVFWSGFSYFLYHRLHLRAFLWPSKTMKNAHAARPARRMIHRWQELSLRFVLWRDQLLFHRPISKTWSYWLDTIVVQLGLYNNKVTQSQKPWKPKV